MKNLFYITLSLMFLLSCGGNTETKDTTNENTSEKTEENTNSEKPTTSKYSNTKYFDIKSGIIEYEIKSEGEIANIKMEIKGTRKYCFKDWGAKTSDKENIEETTNGVNSKSKSLEVIKDGKEYSVDFELGQITKKKDIRTLMLEKQKGKSYNQINEDFIKELGGKKIGSEKIKGYECDVWEVDVNNTKVWIYKGIELKIESKTMGNIRTEEAVKVEFNTSVDDDNFELPNNFNIAEEEVSLDDMPNAEEIIKEKQKMEAMKNMSFEEWKKEMTKKGELENVPEEQLKKIYEEMQKMLKKQ